MNKFKLNLNLDDEEECVDFIQKHGKDGGRRLANKLGLHGKGSSKLATALSNFAWNKYTAINLRKKGNIPVAMNYEKIADRIYKNDIQPVCDCW